MFPYNLIKILIKFLRFGKSLEW